MKQSQSADLEREAGDIIMMCKELPGDIEYARELALSHASEYVSRLRPVKSRRK